MLELVYVALSLAPAAAFVALASWVAVKAVSVRIVWREAGRHFDDEPAA